MILETDVVAGLTTLHDNCADIVLADPPYNIGKDFGTSKDSLSLPDYLEWSKLWINESLRILKDSGTLYIYGFAEILSHISVMLNVKHRWLVWHYTNKTVPHFHFWQRSHESILCCWKDDKLRIFNLDDVREPYTQVFLKNAAGKKRKSTTGRYSHSDKETIYTAHDKGALPRDVIEVSALAGGAGRAERWFLCHDCKNAYSNAYLKEHAEHRYEHHPTQKPYDLTERLLKAAKPEKGLVVIPFAGSGAECAVAEDLGMKYIGFDNNPDYVLLATSFLKNRKEVPPPTKSLDIAMFS